MRNILHHTRKYDGSLHYRFQSEIVYNGSDTLVTYRGPGIAMESYRGDMTADGQLLLFYYANRYHNTIIMWQADWTPLAQYVNIATPAEWDKQTVSAVDLDLDLIREARNAEIMVDDEDEFEEHIELFSYPQELVRTCRSELDKLIEVMRLRQGVFSDAIYEWRPGMLIDGELVVPT